MTAQRNMMVNQKRRKGQALVIEEIIFIGLGVMLLVGIGSIFNSMSGRASEGVEVLMAEEVANTIAASADKLAAANATGRISVDVPETINNKDYYVEGYGEMKLVVRMEGLIITRNVTAPVTGAAHSSYGRVAVSYNRSHITLRGESY